MAKSTIEQYKPSAAEAVRRELDPKIESKVSNHVFYPILTALIIAISGSYYYTLKATDKIDNIRIDFAKLQTKIETKIQDKKL